MDITLARAMAGFRLSNEAAGLSTATISWYENNLRLFLQWFQAELAHDPNLVELTGDVIRKYLMQLRTQEQCFQDHPYHPEEQRTVAPRTIQAYYSSLSAFCNWAVREELLAVSPVKNVPRPKVPRYMPDPFNEEEIRALLKACKTLTDKSGTRMVAMLLCLLDTGVRVGELLSLKLADVELDLGRARVMGKGSKERYVFFGKATKRALWRYISLARSEPRLKVENLFLSFDGRPLQYRRFADRLRELGKRAGVENVHPHRFRRTAAVQFLRNGGDLLSLQKLLGHESLEMVRRYVELAVDDVADAHRKASPVDAWRL